MFYLHQHLLLKFHTPRFSESDSNYHFKNYSPHRKVWNSAEPISLQDMYLYIPKEKGPAGKENIIFLFRYCFSFQKSRHTNWILKWLFVSNFKGMFQNIVATLITVGCCPSFRRALKFCIKLHFNRPY